MNFHFLLIILPHQIEEDIGSAEEQPISNRFDAYTKNEAVKTAFFLFHFLVWLMALKNLLIDLIFIIQIPF